MKKQPIEEVHAPMPEREELRALPRAPHLVMDVSRMLRYRVRGSEAPGVMSQHAARALMAHLAVGGSASQLALAEKTGFSTPTVSILLRKMEEEGYVCRTPDPHDRRVMLVSLTEKGKGLDKKHLDSISENDRRAMRGFSPEEEELLVSMLQRMYDNLKER